MSKALSQEAIANLITLADEARLKRQTYATALQQHRDNKVSVLILKGQVEASRREYTSAYRALGMNRQEAWQFQQNARGLCRLCPEPVVPGTKHCAMHEAWLHSPVRKKLVQP